MSGARRWHELVPERLAAAYFAGACVGAAMTAVMLVFGLSTPLGAAPDLSWRLGEIVFIAAFAFPIAAIMWSVGGILALPLWYIMHRAGLVGPKAAALSGMALVTIAFLALSGAFGVLNAMAMGVVSGASAGLALWRVAYRRTDSRMGLS